MAVKTKSKTKARGKAKQAKAKALSSQRKSVSARAKRLPPKKTNVAVTKSESLTSVKPRAAKPGSSSTDKVRVVHRISAPNSSSMESKLTGKGLRVPQYNYMKAPGAQHDFQVGNSVEVYCDHEKNRDRVRGWIGGIVVQVDNKMVAVQFRSNVYLTDGWMVPDRILWYPLNSEHIRPFGSKKNQKRDEKVLPPEF